MENIIPFSQLDLAKITNHRNGEVKFGEKMKLLPKDTTISSFLETCEAKFVLFGIPEDIGVRANFGKKGAASAWKSAIASIANIQHSKFCKGSSILLLGEIDVKEAMQEVENLNFNEIKDRKKFSDLVSTIDKEVVHIVSTIVKAGKIPIIIGGGHNNAYGNIKGTALGKGKPINAINLDAHSDFRIPEGRHSGNGFRYAYDEGFLKNYFIFGLHENYTSKNVLQTIKENDDIQFVTYDEIAIRKEKNLEEELKKAFDFVNSGCYGLEIDLDALPNIASSAMTPSGFSIEMARQFVYQFGKSKNASYLHICEGAPDLAEESNKNSIGKLIGYLVTDFMKARLCANE